MQRAVISWPWFGLLVALALVGQEVLFRWFGDVPSLAESLYRVFVVTVGTTSLAMLLLPMRRVGYLLGFLVCAALMGWALWLEYGQGLEPCPLCMFQRFAVIAIGVIFLLAFIHNPFRFGAAAYAVLILLASGLGAAFAGRQIWLQALPKDQVPACGMGISYMMDTMPFLQVLERAFAGSGECAEKGWELLGLSIAGWTLVFFVAITIYAFALIRRD